MINGREIFDNYNKTVELYNTFNELKKENEQLKQEKVNYIKMLNEWENLVCVGLSSEGCCPSCEKCMFGELKEEIEKINSAIEVVK